MPRKSSGESKLVRCLALLLALTKAHRGVNIRQFAERKGWDWRYVYRDLETLREAGFPVERPEHGWFLLPEHWLPPATVDVRSDELMALCIARQLAPGLKDTAIGRALDSLWSKLSAPGHQPQLPLGDEAWFRTASPPAIEYGPHQAALDAVRDALRRRCALRIHYRKPDGQESERIIEPTFVHWDSTTETMYVSAWCRQRDDQRMFAIHRILRAELTDQPFALRREAVAEMNKAFRLWPRKTTERIVLRFSPRVAGEVRERRWHRTARLTGTDDGGVVLEMEVGAPEELERLVLGYGPDVQVDAPATFATRIREQHAAALGPARLGTLRARRAERAPGSVAPRRVRSKPGE